MQVHDQLLLACLKGAFYLIFRDTKCPEGIDEISDSFCERHCLSSTELMITVVRGEWSNVGNGARRFCLKSAGDCGAKHTFSHSS